MRYAVCLWILLLAGYMTRPSIAQDSVPTGPGVAEKEPLPPLREQTIYVPFSKLRETFEKDGRGVFLPYEKFQELWRAARGNESPVVPVKSPEGALITEIDSTAAVEKEVVRVNAKLTIDLLSKGWHRVPIRLGDSAIIHAKIGDQPARVIFEDQQGYFVLLEQVDEKPRTVVVELEYAKAFTKNPGQNTVGFEAPQAPVNRWQFRVPQTGAKITIQPMIAASEQPPAMNGDKPVEETRLLAFVGAAAHVRVDWTGKAEGATGLTALVNAQVQQMITINEGAIRTRAQIAYDISRAELSQFVLEVPADQKVVNVFDPNVRQWEVKAEGELQLITVQLFQPIRGAQNLVVELERFLSDMNQKELRLPTVKAVGAGRQQGIVVISVNNALRSEVLRRVGLTQLGIEELPDSLKASKWEYSYRYAAVPFDLAVATEKVLPRIRATELAEVYLEPEQMAIDLLAVYQIDRAGVFQLELDVPADFEVRGVNGVPCAPAGAQPVQVDSYNLIGEKKTRLVVNLTQRAIGSVALAVQLRKALDQPSLLTPSDESTEIPLPIPRVAAGASESTRGRVIVYAPESLRVNIGQHQGARLIPIAEALQGMESMRAGRYSNLREVLALAYTQQPAQLALATNRRKPDVSVRQLLVTTVNNQSVEFEARFYYDIRYSGVKSLQIKLPLEIVKEQVRNETPGVRERALPPSGDAPDNQAMVTWSFTGDTEFIGSQLIRLTWKRVIGELEAGKPFKLDIPQLIPANVNRSTGQVVIKKAETLDIHPEGEPKGIRPIDPQHDLIPEAGISDAARAFEFQENWSLALQIARYKLEEVKRTSVEQALVRMVVTRSHRTAVQAVYRARSAHQRLAIVLPADFALDTQPLRVNGRPQALERGDKDELYIPLVGQNPNDPFLVELRYTVPGDHRQLSLPQFGDDAAVQQVYLAAYLPKDWSLLGSNGPWTEEFTWERPEPWLQQIRRVDLNELFTNLVRGIPAEKIGATTVQEISNSFPIDGTLFLFSTLRPEPAPTGDLQLVAHHRTWVHGMVFAVIALIGIALTGRGISLRIVLVIMILIAFVLAAVILPTFVQQITDTALFAAIGLVFMVWLAELAIRWVTQRPHREAISLGDVLASASTTAATGSANSSDVAAASAKDATDKSQPSGSPFGNSGSNADSGGESTPGDSKGGSDHA